MQRLVHILITLFFPSQFNKEFLRSIPKAPEPIHANIFSLYDYQHPLGRKLIYSIKKRRDKYLSQLIAEEMSLHLQEYISEQQQFSHYLCPLVVSVPLTPKQEKYRGFNQVSNIAQYLSKLFEGKCIPIIIKTRETHKQALIKNKSQRFLNVRGCFGISHGQEHSVENKDIIIVDDLITTGATILEIEKVLYRYGARNVIAITIAH